MLVVFVADIDGCSACWRATRTPAPATPAMTTTPTPLANPGPHDTAGQVALDYCAAVRGILNDDQGGPLHPPGMRMAEALAEVRASLGRARVEKNGGPATTL